MKITLLCSNSSHPVYSYLSDWRNDNKTKYEIQLINRIGEVKDKGDILFLISCSEIIKAKHRDKFRYTLVLHASDLPEGRGWSPHIWDIANGSNELTLSLLNAEDSVDTGDIWQKKKIKLTGSELYDEINDLLFNAELALISWACENIDNAEALPQVKINNIINYYRQRTPNDSELDPEYSISSQLNLLRVCDPNRYPAYFYQNGQKYLVTLFNAKSSLISRAYKQIDSAEALPLLKIDDSELDPESSISSQINVLKMCDLNGFAAYFCHNGQKFTVTVIREN